MSNLHYLDYLYFNESITPKIASESTKMFTLYVVHKHHFIQINDRHYVLASTKKNLAKSGEFLYRNQITMEFYHIIKGLIGMQFLNLKPRCC
jgi:hypothetical protein